MEAAVREPRTLESEKARRIVAAMRASVGRRGAAGATFDHVSREAGVSRGLLHYYFGSKERLLVEVVRHDSHLRLRALEEHLSGADSVDAIVDVLVTHLQRFLRDDPAAYSLIFEMFSASRRNEDVRREMAALYRRVRDHIARVLAAKHAQGVVSLRSDAEAVASALLALGDGVALQVLSDPEWDSEAAFAAGILTARFLFGAAP